MRGRRQAESAAAKDAVRAALAGAQNAIESDHLTPQHIRHTTRRNKMAAKDRMAVLSAMMEQGVIPVFYHPDVEVCRKVIQACANGGAKCIEFTNRGDFASHVFSRWPAISPRPIRR